MKIKSVLLAIFTAFSIVTTQYDQSFAVVTLEETLKYAFDYNPNIKAAQEARQEAVHRVREARAGYFPTIGVWASGGFEQNDEVGTRSSATDDDVVSTYGAGLQFSQPIFSGGETTAKVALKNEELNYKALELMDSANSIAYSAISAHADILRRQKLVEFATNNVNEHNEILKLLRVRLNQGLSSRGDIDIVNGRLKRAEATLRLYKQGLELAKNSYIRITGRDVDFDMARVLEPKKMYFTVEEAKKACLNENIRIQADMAAIRSALAEGNVGKSNFLPRLNLDGGTNFLDKDYDGNNKQLNWSVGLNVEWNLFNGGADVANLKANSANVRELRQRLHATMDTVNEEITSTFTTTGTALELVDLYESSAYSAERAKKNYILQFEVGKKDLLSVLDAEGEYFYSIVEREVNETDALLGKYRLLAISGELLEEIGMSKVDLENNRTDEDTRWSIKHDSYYVQPPSSTKLND